MTKAAQAMKLAWQIFKQEGVRTMDAWKSALKKAWAVVKYIAAQSDVVRKETHEATANQIRKLGEYGVDVSGLKGSRKWNAGYNQCKEILEVLGWYVEGRKLVYIGEIKEVYTETLAEAYGF